MLVGLSNLLQQVGPPKMPDSLATRHRQPPAAPVPHLSVTAICVGKAQRGSGQRQAPLLQCEPLVWRGVQTSGFVAGQLSQRQRLEGGQVHPLRSLARSTSLMGCSANTAHPATHTAQCTCVVHLAQHSKRQRHVGNLLKPALLPAAARRAQALRAAPQHRAQLLGRRHVVDRQEDLRGGAAGGGVLGGQSLAGRA